MSILLEDLIRIDGYGATAERPDQLAAPETTCDEYARDQVMNNVRVTRRYIEPLCERTSSHRLVDLGCGVGTGVMTLLEDGYDAYGVDLATVVPFWRRLECPRDRFFVVSPEELRLPFVDDSVDLVYSLGVIEHVGTVDGHATRRDDYHERRKQWLREVFRVVRPGGHIMIGGPNRNFPFDFSHDLDAAASRAERWVSRAMGVSIHRIWGDYFLWGYGDIPRYLAGLEWEFQALPIGELLQYSRVPRIFRRLAKGYVDSLPERLLATGFNPWILAPIRKGTGSA